MEGDIYCSMCVCLIGCVQSADCSGRTLATLLVAWIATLMVTSILLKWEYMWIVVTILTLLFLLICICIAYNIKKALLRSWFDEYQRAENETREIQQRGSIWTISGVTVDNCRETESHRIVDLPPSYSSVVQSVQSTSESSRPSLNTVNSSDDSKCEDPPPYSSVISSTGTCDRSAETANQTNTISSATKNNTVFVNIPLTQDTHTTDD